MRIDKVNWITAHNYCKPKQTNEPKLVILVSFSQEKLPHTLIAVIASTFCGKCVIPFFFWATLCNYIVTWEIWLIKFEFPNSFWGVYFSLVRCGKISQGCLRVGSESVWDDQYIELCGWASLSYDQGERRGKIFNHFQLQHGDHTAHHVTWGCGNKECCEVSRMISRFKNKVVIGINSNKNDEKWSRNNIFFHL